MQPAGAFWNLSEQTQWRMGEIMSVIVRTHGGLGNQIFQILFARLYSESNRKTLKEIYDGSYYHGFQRSSALYAAPAPSKCEKFVSSLRVPKILKKLHIRGEYPLRFLGSVYIDDYFQTVTSYTEFKDCEIRNHLKRVASELGIDIAYMEQTLVHIRLGDFFKTRDEAREHAVARLQGADRNSAIMTNDEKLLDDPDLRHIRELKNCKIVSTEGMGADEILQLMSRYRRIDANDSTLVFWASVLGGSETSLRNAKLRATQEYFKKCMSTSCLRGGELA